MWQEHRVRRSGLFVAAAFTLSVLLAGCVGGEDPAPSEDAGDVNAPDKADDIQTTAGAGTIKGQVFGADNLDPLGGAKVNLVRSDSAAAAPREAIVAKNGDYVINNVEPGRYSVIVFAIGYNQGAKAVDVRADNVHEVSFQLEPLPSDKPYDEWIPYTGILRMSIIWQAEIAGQCHVVPTMVTTVKSCGGFAFFVEDEDNQEIAINITEDVETIIVEMVWQPAGVLGEYMQLDLLCADVPRANSGAVLDINHPCYFQTDTFESPIAFRVDSQHWKDNGYNHTGDWAARVFASYGMLGTYDLTKIDLGVAYEQTFDIYVSVFHKEPAPEGHSGIPDA